MTETDDFPLIPAELRENYAAIVAERGISYEHLADNADETGATQLAAYLRSQAKAGAPSKARAAKPSRTA